MKIIILEEAFEELSDAITYYEDKQADLGIKLKDEIDQHINWIIKNSTVPQLRKSGFRRVNLKIFPFYIAYTNRENTNFLSSNR